MVSSPLVASDESASLISAAICVVRIGHSANLRVPQYCDSSLHVGQDETGAEGLRACVRRIANVIGSCCKNTMGLAEEGGKRRRMENV